MKSYKNITATLLAGLLIMGLSACEKGPAENGGTAGLCPASDRWMSDGWLLSQFPAN